MKNILVIGAGRSSQILINYLLDHSVLLNWKVIVADYSLELAEKAVSNHKNGKPIFFNVLDYKQRKSQIANSDIVISMLPASMHIIVAEECISLNKNLVTASYVSEQISNLDKAAINAGVLLLNEIGLDPGIDHMSAMKIIEKIKEEGGDLYSFKSYCGGLVHPNFDNNPWNYKFTWNPRNVVLAGQGTARYIESDLYKYIPYSKLFQRTESVNITDLGEFEGYANRDSLSYRKLYGIENISTLIRGTLRKKGFCNAWDVFVQLGMTDDSYKFQDSNKITNREFINSFLPYDKKLSVEEKLCKEFNIDFESDIYKKIKWLDLFLDVRIFEKNASPAQMLQAILEKKWSLDTYDKDMIVMQHQFKYLNNGLPQKLKSSLVVYGEDSVNTAMAKTVGLPVAIATKLILEGKINLHGVHIPTSKQIYLPILSELEEYGITFFEELV